MIGHNLKCYGNVFMSIYDTSKKVQWIYRWDSLVGVLGFHFLVGFQFLACFSIHDDTFSDNWYLFTHEKTEEGAMTSPTFQGSYKDIKKIN